MVLVSFFKLTLSGETSPGRGRFLRGFSRVISLACFLIMPTVWHVNCLVILVKSNTHFIVIFSMDVYVLIINECDEVSQLSKHRVSDFGTSQVLIYIKV